MSYTQQHTGLILMVFPLILTVAAPISGDLLDKIGSEILTRSLDYIYGKLEE